MSVYTSNTGKKRTYFVVVRYEENGERKQTTKRGFMSRSAAEEWEDAFLNEKRTDLKMTFATFVKLYREDCEIDLRDNTMRTRDNIIDKHIMPYFGKMSLCDIRALDVERWQTSMKKKTESNGKPFSQTYLRSIKSRLNAIFNHAVRYYDLPSNPALKAKKLGEKVGPERPVWTLEEYFKFSDAIMDTPVAYYAFEVLYFCGLRLGELLAITVSDLDLDNGILHITKSLQHFGGEDIITSTKTAAGVRMVYLPKRLTEELREYLACHKTVVPDMRLFPVTKSYMHRIMDKGCEISGVQRIRIHDLRHSHVSALSDMGIQDAAIANRVGHASVQMTRHYTHVYAAAQQMMADMLNQKMEERYVTEKP